MMFYLKRIAIGAYEADGAALKAEIKAKTACLSNSYCIKSLQNHYSSVCTNCASRIII